MLSHFKDNTAAKDREKEGSNDCSFSFKEEISLKVIVNGQWTLGSFIIWSLTSGHSREPLC